MEKDLEQRTKQFSLAVIRYVSKLSRSREVDILARQLLRSATSIGANYREANRGVSRADFTNKIGIIQKEAAETQYWLKLLIESDLGAIEPSSELLRESGELLAIFTSSGKRLKTQPGASSNFRN
jgi:four helix bundle protein